jgi:serine/threonine protein kinase
MSTHSDSQTAGDYHLLEVLAEDETRRVWLAEQLSIGRKVVVEELRPEYAARRDDFLANARAKAAVDHPLVATVYEAVADDDRCFFAHELLPSHTLDAMLAVGGALAPARIAQLLRRVAEAQLHHETAGHATSALGLENIHVDEHEMVRLDNLAIAGSRDPGQSAADITRLGHALRPLVGAARPGSTRVLTLLAWMRGEEIASPLDWRQVMDVCQQIEHQLSHPAQAATRTQAIKQRKIRISKSLATAITACGLVLIFILLWRSRPQSPPARPQLENPAWALVGAGKHPTPDGLPRSMPAFRIAAREVSVGEYAEFLQTLEALSTSGLERSFDHRNQPPEKTTHTPDNWLDQSAASHGLPVTGVDWWDAAAYAAWKKAELPTQEQWFVAICGTPPLPAGSPVISHSVREWTRLPASDPANPLGGTKWVIIGKAKNASASAAREWITDLSLRRPDLGFRICRDDK